MGTEGAEHYDDAGKKRHINYAMRTQTYSAVNPLNDDLFHMLANHDKVKTIAVVVVVVVVVGGGGGGLHLKVQ